LLVILLWKCESAHFTVIAIDRQTGGFTQRT